MGRKVLKVLKVFFALLLSIILSIVSVPVYADGFGGGAGRSDFFTWANGFDGGSFGGGAGRGDKDAYDDCVQTLPATGYDSVGGLTVNAGAIL